MQRSPAADGPDGTAQPRSSVGGFARRFAVVGFWTGRLLLAVLVLLYGLSFVAPPPVDRQPLDYDEGPTDVASDAVQNLRTETYRYTIDAMATEDDETRRVYAASFSLDNRARLYRAQIRTTDTGFADGDEPQRFYGTPTVGYDRYPASSRNVYAGSWHRDVGDGYTAGKNAFARIQRLADAPANVVADNASWYVVRVDTGAIEADVAYPGRPDPGENGAPNALTLGIRKATDRLAWARYRADGENRSVVATYRFERGWAVDVDRPLATYPPSSEIVARINVGIGAAEALLLGGGRS